ncbi:MAG: hypothetical protein HY319_21685 [Armatimonadetes bacterium]|nr:hypothetical protein [Armatimonadota bacterium]
MDGWDWDWAQFEVLFSEYSDSLGWLLVIILLLYTVGVHGLFYPIFYHYLGFQATTSIRLAYVTAFVVALGVAHWWAWEWLFESLLYSYWMWLAWFVIVAILIMILIFIPKKKVR